MHRKPVMHRGEPDRRDERAPARGQGSVRIEFTRHALQRMRERGVSAEDVYEALGNPDELLLDTETDRIVAVKHGKGLCVIVEARGDTVKVITVIVTPHLKRLVERRKKGERWKPWPGKRSQ